MAALDGSDFCGPISKVGSAGHGVTFLAWQNGHPVCLAMLDGHTNSPLFRHRHWAELVALYAP